MCNYLYFNEIKITATPSLTLTLQQGHPPFAARNVLYKLVKMLITMPIIAVIFTAQYTVKKFHTP